MPTKKKGASAASKKTTTKQTALSTSSVRRKSVGKIRPQAYASALTAVKKKGWIKENHFEFAAVPPLFKKEQFDSAYKRFHGARMLASWLPKEFIDNNTDRFGYLFPELRRAANLLPYTPANRALLEKLGDEMGNKDSRTPVEDLLPVPDSTIPAGYTYLGQFIDHDITLDVNSDINTVQDAARIPNMRSPSLDLDAIYGQGPGLTPYLYDHADALGRAKGVKLLLGTNTDTGNGGPALKAGRDNFGNPATIPGGNNFDVPRSRDLTAIIGDPRNDENLLVGQLHHSFIKFHNKVVDQLVAANSPGDLFTEAKRLTTQHYQWIIVHDFLKKVADPAIVERVFQRGARFFRKKPLFMPVEFSVAAYRFGHSMIRNAYFVNAPLTGQLGNAPASLGQVFEFIRIPLLPVTSNWVVDFNLYFQAMPIPTINNTQFNFARKIDTRLALGLESLPDVPVSDSFMKMLAKRNLVRGMALGLPSGQSVARHIRTTVLTKEELLSGNTAAENAALQAQGELLLKKTPLWYYILKEAEVKKAGNSLGDVGSTILAETFYRLLKDDAESYLNTSSPVFKPTLPRFGGRPPGDFDMADMLHLAGLLTLDQ